jgi:DNA polymerase III subunit delta'
VKTVLDEVLEQPNGVRFLRRVVERKFTSPLLLVGEEGVVRRFSALQATKELFCVAEKKAGCRCFHCTQVDRGLHPDLMIVGPDNGEVKVGAIRELVLASRSFPSIADAKVFIVDGADKMNTASANAILKTLEEPPASSLFFLLAESAERVIPTIRSRCGLVQYQTLSEPLIVSVLQRSEDDSAKSLIIARMSEGSVGRAVQYMGAGRLAFRDKVFSFIRLALEKNIPGLFGSIDAIEKELPLALRFLEQLVHDIIMVRSSPTRIIHEDLRDEFAKMRDKSADEQRWYKLLHGLRALREKIRSRVHLTFHVKSLFAQAFWV